VCHRPRAGTGSLLPWVLPTVPPSSGDGRIQELQPQATVRPDRTSGRRVRSARDAGHVSNALPASLVRPGNASVQCEHARMSSRQPCGEGAARSGGAIGERHICVAASPCAVSTGVERSTPGTETPLQFIPCDGERAPAPVRGSSHTDCADVRARGAHRSARFTQPDRGRRSCVDGVPGLA
jgi:hypothetical protein